MKKTGYKDFLNKNPIKNTPTAHFTLDKKRDKNRSEISDNKVRPLSAYKKLLA